MALAFNYSRKGIDFTDIEDYFIKKEIIII